MQVVLEKIKTAYLKKYLHWQLPHHKHHQFNGPYFANKDINALADWVAHLRTEIDRGNPDVLPQKRMIIDANKEVLIGEVSWYWRSSETYWMEIGIVIFNENYWNRGIGYQALRLWIDHLFATQEKIIRLGLTTWSGNHGMMRLAEKLNFQKEALYRKARMVEGKYYDSVSYGILREEWEKLNR